MCREPVSQCLAANARMAAVIACTYCRRTSKGTLSGPTHSAETPCTPSAPAAKLPHTIHFCGSASNRWVGKGGARRKPGSKAGTQPPAMPGFGHFVRTCSTVLQGQMPP